MDATKVSLDTGIVTNDIAALAAFYCDGLGFTVAARREFPQGKVWRLVRDHAFLKLYQPAAGAAAPPPRDPWFRDRGHAYAALNVDDADAEVAPAQAAGAVVHSPVASHRPGAKAALIADPEGNVWEVLEDRGEAPPSLP